MSNEEDLMEDLDIEKRPLWYIKYDRLIWWFIYIKWYCKFIRVNKSNRLKFYFYCLYYLFIVFSNNNN